MTTQTKSQHTPGPYSITYKTPKEQGLPEWETPEVFIQDSNGMHVAQIHPNQYVSGQEDYMGNANLLRAAPDLLDALTNISEHLLGCAETGRIDTPFAQYVSNLAEKAIYNATK